MPPSLERHFVPATLLGLVRRGHPYDFADTYRAQRVLYGYGAAYVNLGLWDDGIGTVDAGRRLAEAVAAPLALAAGEALVEVGSGLGQAAVDLCHAHALARVTGINPNARQSAFARDLVAEAGLEDRITFVEDDAAHALRAMPEASTHGVLAVECVGHFSEPDAFLAAAHRALVPGRRLAFCLNVAASPLASWEALGFRATFGFVPATAATWSDRLTRAGFEDVRHEDLTERVTGTAVRAVASRLDGPEAAGLPLITRWTARLLNEATARAVRGGRLRYLRFDARRASS